MTERTSSAERFASLSREKAALLQRLLEDESRQAQRIKPRPGERNSEASTLPVAWAQQRLWFIEQLEGGNAAYHIALALRLKGHLNESALRRALDTIVSRHESLRTIFSSVDGVPQQEVLAPTSFALSMSDLSTCEPADRDE